MKTNRLIKLFIFSIAPLFSFAQTFEEKGYHPMIKEGNAGKVIAIMVKKTKPITPPLSMEIQS